MEIFNIINNRLEEKNFKREKIPEIEKLAAATYKSITNYVIVKKIFLNEEVQDIKSYSNKIRKILLSQNINVNNTYLLLCYAEAISYETFFMTERDTQGLRKYVIRYEEDLNRIPFLDNLVQTTQFDLYESTDREVDTDLFNMHKLLEKNNGLKNKLTREKIEEIVKELLTSLEDGYANK